LYDQAFALLGFSAAAGAPQPQACTRGARPAAAGRHRAAIWHGTGGGYLSEAGVPDVRESNPHMHLLEAYISWAQQDGSDPSWQRCASDLVALALDRMLLKDTGAICENYSPSWLPVTEGAGRRIEPGHQYEWAWLLMRSDRRHDPRCLAAALRLIEIAETRGLRDGYVVNALNADFTVLDARARLWPQTERIKATALAAHSTGAAEYPACTGATGRREPVAVSADINPRTLVRHAIGERRVRAQVLRRPVPSTTWSARSPRWTRR
jgi:mannose-1-phosphate guanylyltransferase/mannose-6-phosphate isomerase